MKNYVPTKANRRVVFRIIISLIFLLYLNITNNYAQVSFTQTTNADFNLGFLENMTVSSNNLNTTNKAIQPDGWLTTTILPNINQGHQMVAWKNSYVFLTGGYNGTDFLDGVYSAPIQGGGIGGWTTLNSLPVTLRDHAVVVGINTIYVLGGRTDGLPSDVIYYASINSNGTIGSWQTSSVTLPVPLWGHTAQFVNGYIYVVGGTNVADENSALDHVYYANVYPYNDLSSFSSTTTLPDSVNRHTMVNYDSRIYILGGIDENGNKKNTVFSAGTSLNGTLGSWIAETNLPVNIVDHSSTCFNGMVTILAGDPGGLLSNNVYYADIGTNPLSWNTSAYTMYDRTKEGQAFGANGQIIYAGGENLSETPIHNVRYAPVSLSTNVSDRGGFVSYPFFQLGDIRDVQSLIYTISAVGGSSGWDILYRTAGNNAIWSNWTNSSNDNPAIINQFTRYVQYMFRCHANSTDHVVIGDVSVLIAGSELTGNLNGIDTLFKASSPYWATSSISWTAGTHVIEPGVTVVFLPGTGLEVAQANLKCVGTAVDSIKFTYFTTGVSDEWSGIHFSANSDLGVSSQMSYTIIENAGYGGNNANLYCLNTSEPYITNSTFRGATGSGIHLNNSHINIETSLIRANSGSGLYCINSNPTLINTTMSYNGFGGIHLNSTSSIPNFFNVISDSNLYGLYYDTPDITMTVPSGSLSITNNTYNGYVVPGGVVTQDRNWEHTDWDYFVLGNLIIGGVYHDNNRLTIEPGITVKFSSGAEIQVSNGVHYAGELYAIGTADSTITFTSFNGLPGGWDGIYFTIYSDDWGAGSVLDYCTIENGSQYNLYCSNTQQPFIDNSNFNNALESGILLGLNSNITISNSSFSGNQDGIKLITNNTNPTLTNCDFTGQSRSGIYCDPPGSYPVISNLTFSANQYNGIAYAPGELNASGTWVSDVTHYLTGDLSISGIYHIASTLILEPGTSILAEPDVLLQVGKNDVHYGGGGLQAIGTAGNQITFSPINGVSGGWDGISFPDNINLWGGYSQFKHCIIEKGSAFNFQLENTTQPSYIDSCIIRDGAGLGFIIDLSTTVISNSSISNHADAAISCTSMNTFADLENNTYTGNLFDGVVYPGGTMNVNGTWKDHCDYILMGDLLIMGQYNSPRTLTVEHGTTVKIASGYSIQVGNTDLHYGCGAIQAVGKADSTITFTPLSGTTGDWQGLKFYEYTDSYGAVSNFKHCIIEKCDTISVFLQYTAQPTIDSCTIRDGQGYAFHNLGSSSLITNSEIRDHVNAAVYCVNMNTFANLVDNSYLNNQYNGVEYPGGTMNVNGTWKGECEYIIQGDLIITSPTYNTPLYLNIDSSINVRVASGMGITVSVSDVLHYGTAGIRANGIMGGEITFSPLSGIQGDWEGIHFTDYSDSYGASSWFNHCSIEKGNAYNIMVANSSQPSFDNCQISNSAGYGIHLENSNMTLTSSQITTNGSYGVFLDGSSDATIGNSIGQGCDLYSNGGEYDVYNNSPNNVDARYNYWGYNDSITIINRIYDKYDDASKGIVHIVYAPALPLHLSDSNMLSGSIWYNNLAMTVMDNALVEVKDQSPATIASSISDGSGDYLISKFASGIYDLAIAPSDSWGGSNATDALKVLRHFAQLDTLKGLSWRAGDVNGSNTLNGTDALFILQRFASTISSFPAGDWTFENDNVSINGEDITQDMYMLCYGDVDSSYTPTAKKEPLITLNYDGSMIISSYDEFDLDIKVSKELLAGALSLGLLFPEEFLEIEDVSFSNGIENFIYSAENGILKIAWADLNSMNVGGDEIVFTLHLKSKDLSNLQQSIQLGLVGDSEFANPSGTVIEDVVLYLPEMTILSVGINPLNNDAGFYLSNNQPNPFNNSTIIEYSIPENGKVKLLVYDLLGESIAILVDQDQPSGIHKVEFDGSYLEPGIYLYKIEVSGTTKNYIEIRKMIVSQ